MCLQRHLGLRFEESCKINSHLALKEANQSQTITIANGTKGGRKRRVPILNTRQIEALQQAAAIQGKHPSMIPAEFSYAEFQSACYRTATKTGIKFHAERHAYAVDRYQQLTGIACPVVAGIKHGKTHIEYISRILKVDIETAKTIDQDARQIIAEELGHNRVRITNAYLG